MSTSTVQEIRGDLLKAGHTFASIGRSLDPPVSRTTVQAVAHGRTVSARVRQAIADKIGRYPWDEAHAPDTAA